MKVEEVNEGGKEGESIVCIQKQEIEMPTASLSPINSRYWLFFSNLKQVDDVAQTQPNLNHSSGRLENSMNHEPV